MELILVPNVRVWLFVIKNAAPGKYSLKVPSIGYLSSVILELNINPNRNHLINFELNSAAMQIDELHVIADYFFKLDEKPVSF